MSGCMSIDGFFDPFWPSSVLADNVRECQGGGSCPMRYEYHLGIYFRDKDDYRAIDYIVSPATPPPPFHHTLLVYCLHTLRALRNTAHSELGKELAVILSGEWSDQSYAVSQKTRVINK